MKKIIPYILSVFCIFTLVFMSACDSVEHGSISFTEQVIELDVGKQVDLKKKIEVENIDKEKILFRSLDQNIVIISNDGVMTAVGEGQAYIQAYYKNCFSSLEVKISQKPINTIIPTGLRFNALENKVTWNPVLVVLNGQVKEVSSYTVELTTEGQTKEEKVVGQSSYNLTTVGAFSIRVKCDEYKSQGAVVYTGSDYCEKITVRKLNAPTNIVYNDTTHKLTWDASSDITKFNVLVNNVIVEEKISSKECSLVLNSSEQKQQTYDIKVISVDSNINTDVEATINGESEVVRYTRLFAPELTLDSGDLSWDDKQKGDYHYQICITNAFGTTTEKTLSSDKFTISDIEAGKDYIIQIKVIGDSATYLNSTNISIVSGIEKLKAPTLEFNVASRTFTVSNCEDKVVKLQIEKNGETELLDVENYEYIFENTEVGTTKFKAFVVAENVNEINSEFSNVIEILQLDQIDPADVSQYTQDENYYISFKAIQNANNYEVFVDGKNITKVEDRLFSANLDTVFSEVKTYEIKVIVSADQLNAGFYVLPSQTTMRVIRQENISEVTRNDNLISWPHITSAVSYSYYMTKDGEEYSKQETTTVNTYYQNELDYGHYEFGVIANGWNSSTTLYLSSKDYTTISFDITRKLETPKIKFNKETSILSIEKVSLADNYDILLNDEPLTFAIGETSIDINLSSTVSVSGVYNIKAVAKSENELLLDSDEASINIVKLSKPNSVKVSSSGIIEILVYPTYPEIQNPIVIKGYVLVNDIEFVSNAKDEKIFVKQKDHAFLELKNIFPSTLDESLSTYTVKLKFVANELSTADLYVIDSDFSQFEITRLSTPQVPVINGKIISWEEDVRENFEDVIIVRQDELEKELSCEINSIDVDTLETRSGIDTKKPFSVSVYRKFKGITIDLTETDSINYTSLESERLEVTKLSSNLNMVVVENSGEVRISWDASEISGVNYELTLNDETLCNTTDTYFVSSTLFTEAKEYEVGLIVTKDGYITSDVKYITIERLTNDIILMVLADEEIKFYSESGEKIAGVEATINGEDINEGIYNYDGVFTLEAYLIATVNTSGDVYYLNSDTATFTFKRISAMAAPIVKDNEITWSNIEGVSTYELVISNDDGYSLQVSGNSISVFDDDLYDIIKQVSDSTVNISVRSVIAPAIAKKDEDNLLSSRCENYSTLIKLEDITDLDLYYNGESDDQSEITVSWNYDYTDISYSEIQFVIYKDGQELATKSVSGGTSFVSNDFVQAGSYYVTAKVVGKDNYIDSKIVESKTITRFTPVNNLKMSEAGVFTFDGNIDAAEYVINYYINEEIKGGIRTTSTTYDFSSIIFGQTFSGDIAIKVRTIGGKGIDTLATLSSAYTEDFVMTKLSTANIQIFADKLVVGLEDKDGFDESNCTYNISIYDGIVLLEELKSKKFGNEYNFSSLESKIDITENVELTLKVIRTISGGNYLHSDETQVVVTKLAQITNLGLLKKDNTNEAYSWIRADYDANAGGYKLELKDMVSNEVKFEITDFNITADTQYIEKSLEEVYSDIPANWKIIIYKQGKVDSLNKYIDSAKLELSGKCLTAPNLYTLDGALYWDEVENISDYILVVNESNTLSGFVSQTGTVRYTLLEDFEGDLVIKAKSKGNVGTTLVKENIVLDSLFCEDYSCIKLATITNLAVTNGSISFTEVEGASYKAFINGTVYSLQKETTQATYSTFKSAQMYENLVANTKYDLCIQCFSEEDNVIYSNKSSSISFKILSNNCQGTLEFVFEENSGIKNYCMSNLIWASDANAVNGYELLFDGSESVKTNICLYAFNADDSKYVDGNTHTVKLSIIGSSAKDSSGCYSLTSKYSETVTFKKLGTSTPSLKDGKLVWEEISDADAYVIYLDDVRIAENITGTTYEGLVGKPNENITYSKYAVRAISFKTNVFAGVQGYYKGEDGSYKKITKMHAISNVAIEDGHLVWKMTSSSDIKDMFLSGKTIQTPYTINSNIMSSIRVEFKFKSATSDSFYIVSDGLYNYTVVPQSVIDEIISKYGWLASLAGYDLDALLAEYDLTSYHGWPTYDRGFNDLGKTIASGTYQLFTKQIGDSNEFVTSDYGTGKTVYIPFAPQAQVHYNEYNDYILSWKAVSIPAEFSMPNPTYCVVVENSEGTRSILKELTQTELNMSDLIQNDEFYVVDKDGNKTSVEKIYVYVKGNSDKVLNGKTSNVIELKALGKVVGYIENGEMKWYAQDGASKYIITYISDYETENIETTETVWRDFTKLSADQKYAIYIQAIGDTSPKQTKIIMSGMDTKIGIVYKLSTPSVSVQNGAFVWQHLTNAEAYKVYTYKGEQALPENLIEAAYDLNNNITYESLLTDEHIKYEFRAVGSIKQTFTTDTAVGYLNSDIGSTLYGTTLNTITDIVAKNGVLTWKSENSQWSYKLIFTEVDDEGNKINDSKTYVGKFKDYQEQGYKYFECQELIYGKWSVTVQAYYENENLSRTYTNGGQTGYYLLSVITKVYNFEKYNTVQAVINGTTAFNNIALIDGVFSWEYSGSSELDNYQYELTFESSSGETYNYTKLDNEFRDFILEEIITREDFTLKLRVVPKEGVIDYINSNYITFTNPYLDDNSDVIYQLNSIKDTDFEIKKSETDDLYISWENYKVSSNNTDLTEVLDVEYTIYYYSNKAPEEVYEYCTHDKFINTELMNHFDIEEEFTLYYRVQVNPYNTNGRLNYLRSCLSETRDIGKAKGLSSVSFNEAAQYFYWDTIGTTNDKCYKIRDEVLKSDEYGSLVKDNDGNVIVVRTYELRTDSNLTDKYYPIELGYHRVSVAVVIKTSGVDDQLSSSYTYYTIDVGGEEQIANVKVDLFAIGQIDETHIGSLGTAESPYIITTANHFANIAYRKTKPNYENTYMLKTSTSETKITQTNVGFSFRQDADITGVEPFGRGETDEFIGSYDGGYHTLSWNCNLNYITKSTSMQYISLFSTLSVGAKIENLKVLLNTNGQFALGGVVAGICYQNNGTISNVVIGEAGQTITLSSIYQMSWFGVCSENNGTIIRTVNYYNISITATTKDSLNRRIRFGGICYQNLSIIKECANYGNIYLKSSVINAGGISAINNGTITDCVVKNTSTNILVKDDVDGVASGVTVYFGGIVGQNSGIITYSYVNIQGANGFVINVTEKPEKFYVAGLVGKSDNTNIANCYTYVLFNISTSSNITVNVYAFATIDSTSVIPNTYCYANTSSQNTFVGGNGNGNFNVNSYTDTTYVTGESLNAGESHYNNTTLTLPVLTWENAFITEWQNALNG